MAGEKTSSNLLIHEKSPYLLQHAANPVHWRPWKEETFAFARQEDKPIFLSVGYATCHWCHVMAHESFEDQEVAAVLNTGFVPVKVDREERPDIDGLYMAVCQMMSGRGGWPLTVIMTPDKNPFFAATYIPKNSRFGQPGLLELLAEISRLWTQERSRITDSANKVVAHLKSATGSIAGPALDARTLETCLNSLQERYDPEFGGFGEAPKFPAPHNPWHA